MRIATRAVVRAGALSISLMVFGAAGAHAGTFDVRSCQASSVRSSAAWQVAAQTSQFAAEPHADCSSGAGEVVGGRDAREAILLADRAMSPPQLTAAPVGIHSAVRFVTPASSVIERVRIESYLASHDDDWVPQITRGSPFEPGSSVLRECRVPVSELACTEAGSGRVANDWQVSASAVWMALRCEQRSATSTPTQACSTNGTLPHVAAILYSSIVTVREDVAPSVSPVSVVDGVSGWTGPVGKLRLVGADTLGLRRLELLRGDHVVGTVEGSCVDWSVTPCAEASAGATTSLSGDIPVAGLDVPDGWNELRVKATDAAGNQSLSPPVSVPIARGVPDLNAMAITGAGPSKRLTWSTTDGTAPIASAAARICLVSPTGSSCSERELASNDRLLEFEVAPGVVGRVTLTLTDIFGKSQTFEATAPYQRADGTPGDPPGDPGAQPKTTKLTLSAKRQKGGRLRLSGVASAGAATRVTIKLSAPRRGKSRWTRTIKLKPKATTGRYANTIRIPAAVRAGAKITATATTTPAEGWRAASTKRTVRR